MSVNLDPKVHVQLPSTTDTSSQSASKPIANWAENRCLKQWENGEKNTSKFNFERYLEDCTKAHKINERSDEFYRSYR